MVFSMVANSESEKEDWIRAIGRAIVISRTKRFVEIKNKNKINTSIFDSTCHLMTFLI